MNELDALRYVDFEWAVHFNEVWRAPAVDVPDLHARLRAEFARKLDAMEANPALPPLVVLHFGAEPLPPVRDSLASRVGVVQVLDLAQVGAVLSGARLLALPQNSLGAGYEVLGALDAHVPVLHGECDAAAELALDAAIRAGSKEEFASMLALLLTSEQGEQQLSRLRIFAEDRKRSFGWLSTAWQLWELHANM